MLSILIATRNGADRIPRTLEAFRRLALPSGARIIVVDNGSTDGTRAAIERFVDLPILYLYQPRPGKNAALNLALTELRGEFAVFTDDDVLPDPDWLDRLLEAVRKAPDFDVIGGQVYPVWPSEPSRWILEHVPLGPVYAATDPSWPEGPISPHLVWGANMMVRSRIFESGAKFDEAVGPDGTATYRMGSETSFNLELAARGAKFWYTPKARVGHIIRPEQLERSWILSRAYRFGKSAAQRLTPDVAKLLGYPRYAIWDLLKLLAEGLLITMAGPDAERFKLAWRLRYQLGFLAGARLKEKSATEGN